MPANHSFDPHRAASRRAVVVCGPTAGGKSDLADELARRFSGVCGSWVTTIAVDSMQVYKGLPTITNQRRSRPAGMVGFLPVTEEWNVALHRERSEKIISGLDPALPFLLDAGTGMYLNATLLDIPLAPRAPDDIREAAQSAAVNRREARAKELDMLGAPARGSIWKGPLRYNTTLVYVRPPKEVLDSNIKERSAKIVSEGPEELQNLFETDFDPNPSLKTSIGVREISLHLSGELTLEQARQSIETRTRKLARRQRRWFDKLARSLPEDPNGPAERRAGARVIILESREDLNKYLTYIMHDII